MREGYCLGAGWSKWAAYRGGGESDTGEFGGVGFTRANSIFGIHVWSGNAVGAFLTSLAFAQYGWLAVCAIAMTSSLLAMLIHVGVVPIGRAKAA